MDTVPLGTLQQAKFHHSRVVEELCVRERSSSARNTAEGEKLLLSNSYEESVKLKLHLFYQLELYTLFSVGMVGAIVTFIRSDRINIAQDIDFCFFKVYMPVFLLPLRELCHWKLQKNVRSKGIHLFESDASTEDRLVVKFVLKDPILDLAYTCIIGITFWLAFIFPIELFDSSSSIIGGVAMYLLSEYLPRYIPKESTAESSDNNETDGMSLRGEEDSNGDAKQPLDLESVELLLETTLKQQKEEAGDDSVEGIIENYKAMANQKAKKFSIFLFVYQATIMVIYLLRFLYANGVNTTAFKIWVCIFDELLISTSFYLFGKLTNKLKETLLIEYLQGRIRDVTNEANFMIPLSKKWGLFSGFFVAGVAPLIIVIRDFNEYYFNVSIALWVVFTVLNTNTITTGSALSFRDKFKELGQRV